MFSDEYGSVSEKAAQRWNVSPKVHPQDFIFRFVFEHPSFKSKEKAIEYYFEDGAESAQKLYKLLTDVCGLNGTGLHLLEFASGYGCVTRHLKNVIPSSSIVACDIHKEAVRFLQDELKTDAVLSSHQPEDLYLNRTFDVVFALSFFSHLPKSTFARWLRKLASLVRRGGYLIFTTHGMESRSQFPPVWQFDADGFYFYPTSEQKDLDTEEYGATLVMPQYVFNQISEISNFTLKYFHEGFWWDHQDVYIIKNTTMTLSATMVEQLKTKLRKMMFRWRSRR